jgi:hypothetical protein
MLREDVAELNRLYTRKAADDALPPQKRDIRLYAEISAREFAHDQHWEWLAEIEAREVRRTGEPAL